MRDREEGCRGENRQESLVYMYLCETVRHQNESIREKAGKSWSREDRKPLPAPLLLLYSPEGVSSFHDLIPYWLKQCRGEEVILGCVGY